MTKISSFIAAFVVAIIIAIPAAFAATAPPDDHKVVHVEVATTMHASATFQAADRISHLSSQSVIHPGAASHLPMVSALKATTALTPMKCAMVRAGNPKTHFANLVAL